MMKSLLYMDSEVLAEVILDEILNSPDDNETEFSIEIDQRYPEEKGKKTKNIPFFLEKNCAPQDKLTEYMS